MSQKTLRQIQPPKFKITQQQMFLLDLAMTFGHNQCEQGNNIQMARKILYDMYEIERANKNGHSQDATDR